MLIQYENDHGDINAQKGKQYLPPYKCHRGHRGHDHMVVGFTTTYAAHLMQSINNFSEYSYFPVYFGH
jgi:succinate dehydrogenase flavin-adding protein (antitoxin of CptAB toxin-antitoxin module)